MYYIMLYYVILNCIILCCMPGRSRLFPAVSGCFFGRQILLLDHWTIVTTFNTFPRDPSARGLLEMMHFDVETQYTLRNQKSQDLVKFDRYYITLHYITLYYIISHYIVL